MEMSATLHIDKNGGLHVLCVIGVRAGRERTFGLIRHSLIPSQRVVPCENEIGSELTLMENRFPLGSYRYFPVRVIWGRPEVSGSSERERVVARVARVSRMVNLLRDGLFVVCFRVRGGMSGVIDYMVGVYRRRRECV